MLGGIHVVCGVPPVGSQYRPIFNQLAASAATLDRRIGDRI